MELRDPTHRFEGEIGERTRIIAEIISFLGQPIFLPIPAFLLLCMKTKDAGEYALIASLSLLFVAVIPIVIVYYFSMKLGRKDGDIPDRTQRYVPMVAGIISYTAGTLVMFLVNAPKIITVLMGCYALVTFAMLLITFYWKISIHAVGIIGPSMALSLTFWPWGLLYFLWIPPVFWSRYVLKKHTPAQLAAGALVGFVLVSIVFLLVMR